MATSVYPATGGFVDNTSAAKFIPEIWSDEVIAAYKSNLVLANLVKKMSMTGKKGDVIHVPKPTRGTATAKAANTAVTVQMNVESEVLININKHYEFSRLIEDITEVQALASLRQFYTGDAGYGLARQVDTDLIALGNQTYALDQVVTGDVFNDAGFRDAIQKLDDADVPMDNRTFTVPPSLRNAIMGVDRYMSSDFVEGRGVQNGKIGNLYGIDVYVSSNLPTIEASGDNTAGGAVKAAILCHKDTMVLAEQQAIRSQTQYKQEWLGTLYTADTLYGVQVMRPDAGIVLAVNA